MADMRDETIAELRAIAAQRTAEADHMRGDLVQLRRILGAEEALGATLDRIAGERDRLAAQVAAVERLAALPDPDQPDGYRHYAVPFGGDGVQMAVLVDDLRAALEVADG